MQPWQELDPLPPLPGFPQKSSQMEVDSASRLSPTYMFGALSSQSEFRLITYLW
jgi:hypothetical protein